MPKADDPYYSRKPVPDAFIQDVGVTGLTPEEEYLSREKKYVVDGVDVRRFSTSKAHYDDPYYGRKPIDKTEIHGVGETGLSAEEEYLNRERKFSVNGVDVRRFGDSKAHYDDPYYGRKSVHKTELEGVGDLNMTPAEAYQSREVKESLFQLSEDPFALASGTGHRASVSAPYAGAAAEATRRRSSAVGPNATAATAAANATHGNHFQSNLEPIDSRPELPPVNAGSGFHEASTGAGIGNSNDPFIHDGAPQTSTTTNTHTTTSTYNNIGTGVGTTGTTGTTGHTGAAANGAGATGGSTMFYDSATHTLDDPDSIAPDERR